MSGLPPTCSYLGDTSVIAAVHAFLLDQLATPTAAGWRGAAVVLSCLDRLPVLPPVAWDTTLPRLAQAAPWSSSCALACVRFAVGHAATVASLDTALATLTTAPVFTSLPVEARSHLCAALDQVREIARVTIRSVAS